MIIMEGVNKIAEISRNYIERFIAFFIDWFIILLSILLAIVYQENHDHFFEIRLAITYFFYFTILTAKYGQTIGKRFVKLKVVNYKGSNSVSVTASIYRHLPLSVLFIISSFTALTIDPETGSSLLGISDYIPGIWMTSEVVFYLVRNNGQMLHDYIANTSVVKSI